jgi:hypothetical protein
LGERRQRGGNPAARRDRARRLLVQPSWLHTQLASHARARSSSSPRGARRRGGSSGRSIWAPAATATPSWERSATTGTRRQPTAARRPASGRTGSCCSARPPGGS